MLGLVISSVHNFATELGQDKVVKRHVEKELERTISRTVRSSSELHDHEREVHRPKPISPPYNAVKRKSAPKVGFRIDEKPHAKRTMSMRLVGRPLPRRHSKRSKMLVLREEKDRFEAMRKIQRATHSFKRWWRLTVSIIAFGILWNVGAVVFWQCEKDAQGMTYFQALYLCYVSLLTIGYGDLAPKSNPGRCFFVVWSLIAVPTMTILVSDMGDTVISAFKRGTFRLGDFTFLPKAGIWRGFLDNNPWLLRWLTNLIENRAAKKRLEEGFQVADAEETGGTQKRDIDQLAEQAVQDDHSAPQANDLGRDIARAIRRAVVDMKEDTSRRYTYEEWVEFTRLIRFTAKTPEEVEQEEEVEGLVEWDWIGKDSPMVTGLSEPEFVLDRLCESLGRLMRMVEPRRTSEVPSVDLGDRHNDETTRNHNDSAGDDESEGPSGEHLPDEDASGSRDALQTPLTEEKRLEKIGEATAAHSGAEFPNEFNPRFEKEK